MASSKKLVLKLKKKKTLSKVDSVDVLGELAVEQNETLEELDPKKIIADIGVTTGSTDWTVETIARQMEKGNIDLDPEFQRRDAWRQDRKSRFLESLIQNYPVPQLVLAETKSKDGRFIVIDGKQRLLTIRQFTSPGGEFEPIKLSKLEVRKDLEGSTYESLKTTHLADRNRFDNQAIRTVLIKNWSSEDLLYSVFLRLNNGSLPLSPQELRQAIHPGQFTKSLNTFSGDSKLVQALLGLDAPDFRLRDSEIVLRFIAFRRYSYSYTGSLKALLDYAVSDLNESWSSEKSSVAGDFEALERGIKVALVAFDGNTFRKWNGTRFERALNKAVFDAFIHYFSKAEVASVVATHKAKFLQKFRELCENNDEFRKAIEGTTKSISAFNTRLAIAAKLLASLGVKNLAPFSVGK